MQQTVVVPPPAPPAPPAAPLVITEQNGVTVVSFGDQQLVVPRTEAEVQGLRTKLELIEDQLEQTTERRDELAQALRNGQADEAKAGIQSRIAVLDESILQLEKEKAAIDRALISTPSELLSNAIVIDERPDYNGWVDEDEATFWAFFAFGVGVIGTMVASRIRRRMKKKGASATAAAVMAVDPRIDKLTEAVDAIAEEVERIGEGQRFVTNLLADRRETVAAGRMDSPR